MAQQFPPRRTIVKAQESSAVWDKGFYKYLSFNSHDYIRKPKLSLSPFYRGGNEAYEGSLSYLANMSEAGVKPG